MSQGYLSKLRQNPLVFLILIFPIIYISVQWSRSASSLPSLNSAYSSMLTMINTASGSESLSFRDIKPLAPTDEKVLSYLRDRHLTPPSTGHYALTQVSIRKPSDYRQLLWTLFKDKNDGFFIECGANDGEFLSNTLDLELRQNWSGLLVEAHPVLGAKLKKKKRKAWVADVCLSPDDKIGDLEFLANPKYHGDVPHWKQGVGKLNIVTKNRASLVSYGKVECFPLQSLLAAIGVSHVDFFSLDVEGIETKILKALPYDGSFTIDFIMAETRCAPEEKASMVSFMRSKGYRIYREMSADIIFERINKNK